MALTATTTTTRAVFRAGVAARSAPSLLRGPPGSAERRPRCRRVLVTKAASAAAASKTAEVAASVVPKEYGYVIASLGLTAAVLTWMQTSVGKARVAAGVKYPKAYSDGKTEEDNKFNCAQRAHQNSLETAPTMMVLTGLMGLTAPLASAAVLMVFNLARIVYFLGYSSGDPSKRTPGSAASFFIFLGTFVAALVLGIRSTGVLPKVF